MTEFLCLFWFGLSVVCVLDHPDIVKASSNNATHCFRQIQRSQTVWSRSGKSQVGAFPGLLERVPVPLSWASELVSDKPSRKRIRTHRVTKVATMTSTLPLSPVAKNVMCVSESRFHLLQNWQYIVIVC